MKNIKELVHFALSDKLNKHKEIKINNVTKKQASLFVSVIGKDLQGAERYIDTSTVRHIISKHGSVKKELSRGQIAINLDDFELIPKVLKNATKITYLGKNNLKQDSFEYQLELKDVYVVIEAVRISKRKGDRLYISTMYKKKKRKLKNNFL